MEIKPNVYFVSKGNTFHIDNDIDDVTVRFLRKFYYRYSYGKISKITNPNQRQQIELTLRHFTLCTNSDMSRIINEFRLSINNFRQIKTFEELLNLYCCSKYVGIDTELIDAYVKKTNPQDLSFYLFLFSNEIISNALDNLKPEKQQQLVELCIEKFKNYVLEKCKFNGFHIELKDTNISDYISIEEHAEQIQNLHERIEHLRSMNKKKSMKLNEEKNSVESNDKFLKLKEEKIKLEQEINKLKNDLKNEKEKYSELRRDFREMAGENINLIKSKDEEISHLQQQLNELQRHSTINESEMNLEERSRLLEEEIIILRNELNDKERDNPFNAAENGDYLKLKSMIEKGSDIIKNQSNQTLLHFAAASGNIRCVKLLLNRGYKPNDEDIFGSNPLDWSCSDEISKLLMEKAEANV